MIASSIRSLVLTISSFFLLFGPLAAQSPYTGTYQATVTSISGGITRLGPVNAEFSIENDGTFSIMSNGTILNGSVVADGTVTFTGGNNTLAFTSGRVDNGVMAAGIITPRIDSRHPETKYLLNAPRICNLLPMWQKVSLPGYPTGFYPYNGLGFAVDNGMVGAVVAGPATATGWKFLSSTDGLAWASHPIDLGLGNLQRTYGTRVRFVNGRFMFAVRGDDSGGPTVHFYSSTDGITWTGVDSGFPRNTAVVDIAYAYGKYWALINNTLVAASTLSSPDGITWTSIPLGPEVTNTPEWVQGNGLLMAPGRSGTANTGYTYFTYRTTDGVTWSKVNFLSSTHSAPNGYYF